MSWLNLVSLVGCVVFAGLAWAGGGFRRPVSWRTVGGSALLLASLGVVVFLIGPMRNVLLWVNDTLVGVLTAGNAGADFLFGPLAAGPGQASTTGEPSIGFVLAAQVFPAVIFFASLMAAAYHLKLIQPVVRVFARLFHRTLVLSGAESLAGASNIFFGVESATTIRPYLERATRSELLTVLTCGMSTVASTTLAIYVLFLRDAFPNIAGHLVSASVLSIPAAAMMSKLILPEHDTPETLGTISELEQTEDRSNVMSALAHGGWEGIKLAAGIAALLIAVLGIVGILDLGLTALSRPFAESLGGPLTLGRILGWLFAPIAFLLGIAPGDAVEAGRILGQRVVLTEVVGYQQLGTIAAAGGITPRTTLVLSYALCGFAHVASMGIFVGGIAALGPRALLGATLATLTTGALAGLFYHGQSGILGL
ncbi:MAG: nucleoside permease nupX [bacterium]|nr:nucleoside permease nupX [bacterium]